MHVFGQFSKQSRFIAVLVCMNIPLNTSMVAPAFNAKLLQLLIFLLIWKKLKERMDASMVWFYTGNTSSHVAKDMHEYWDQRDLHYITKKQRLTDLSPFVMCEVLMK